MIPRLSPTSRWLVFAVGLVLATIVSSCVVPTDESAAPVESVPDDLFAAPSSSTTTPEPPPETDAFQLALYWNLDTPDGNRTLISVVRRKSEPFTFNEALALLVEGPNEADQAEYGDVGVIQPRVGPLLNPQFAGPDEAGTVFITVADDFGLRANDQIKVQLAEELVCTLTTLERVSGVVVEDSQGAIPLPDVRTETITGPATRSDYACDPVDLTDEDDGDDAIDDGDAAAES